MDFAALATQCAPGVHPMTMAAISRVESGFNPLAIGVVGGHLARQPSSTAEAVATAHALARDGFNFSVGISQVNRYNLPRYGLDYESAFEPCNNLRVGAAILSECFGRAKAAIRHEQPALQAAFSCYYSGNFSRGFRPDSAGQPSYVQKVLYSAGSSHPAVSAIPVTKAKGAGQGSRAAKAPVPLTAEPAAPQNAAEHVFGSSPASVMVFR